MASSIDYSADGKLLAAVEFKPGRFVVLVDREDIVPGFRFVVASYRSGDNCWSCGEYRGTVESAREAFREKAVERFADAVSDALFGITSHAVLNGFVPDFSERRS